jgi:hypothetical protein
MSIANPDAVRGIGIGMQESWSAIVMLLAHGITLGPIYVLAYDVSTSPKLNPAQAT